MSCNNIFCKNDKFNPFITFLSKAQRSKLLMRRVLLLLALASVLVLAGGETNGICVSWHVSPLMALIASCLRHCPSKWGRQLTHISQSRSAPKGETERSETPFRGSTKNQLSTFTLGGPKNIFYFPLALLTRGASLFQKNATIFCQHYRPTNQFRPHLWSITL